MASSRGGPFPKIDVLHCLETIVRALEAEKTLTATKLKRTYEFDDKIFDEAVDYGHKDKIIKWGDRNKFSFVSSYVIPEEAYYVAINECLRQVWIEDGFDPASFYIENTSRKDSKISGPWSRPDFTVVSHKKSRLSP